MSTWVSLKDGVPTDESAGFPRKDHNGFHMGGCYMYAYDPSGSIETEEPDFLDERVIYIGTSGSSTSRGIRSRTADFRGTILKGYNQKNPYANGILFRGKYGEEELKHVYVSYFPLGYGKSIKAKSHKLEGEMLRQYRTKFGSLPPCDGSIPNLLNVKELLKIMTEEEMRSVKEYIGSMSDG